jgi:hypothetical protein
MSPIGGVGIDLAMPDAVATAYVLAAPLAARRVAPAHVANVQRRRETPTRFIQPIQLLIQKRVIAPTLRGAGPP